ncbi:hypothetical protein MKY91_20290 [Alkalicoccobacillus gibsonii]|uniref:Uncharacterized protein n=1 Tax=Alkalicoccobacillus gibsonii TaxID=79881 RepID=A0ABU9VNM6_9BACI
MLELHELIGTELPILEEKQEGTFFLRELFSIEDFTQKYTLVGYIASEWSDHAGTPLYDPLYSRVGE